MEEMAFLAPLVLLEHLAAMALLVHLVLLASQLNQQACPTTTPLMAAMR